MKADMNAHDRGEQTALMEPLLLGPRYREPLTDMALDPTQKSAAFRASLPASVLTSLAELVRSMNCYYSNLIEGHNTHPVEIERALRNEYSTDAHKRDLQIEAKAHIAVQRWIDAGGLKGRLALSVAGLLEMHRRFGESPWLDYFWLRIQAR